jgi:alpha-glucosidase
VSSPERLAAYLRPDELHTAFDFDFLRSAWSAAELRAAAAASLEAHDSVGAPVMWTLSNHDITRHVSRLGRAQIGGPVELFRTQSGPVDVDLGRRRARALLLLELALPGGVYLYQGEELGLEEVLDLPEELLQDPTWERSGHTERGRDGCRVPLPWTTSGPSLGFGSGPGWLPQPPAWGQLSVEAQDGDPESMLTLYRSALQLRRSLPALGAGSGQDVHWLELGNDAVGFSRKPGFTFILNLGAEPLELPPGTLLVASGPLSDGRLPTDTAAWLTTA